MIYSTLARCSTICAYPRSVTWTFSLAIIQLPSSLGVKTAESKKNIKHKRALNKMQREKLNMFWHYQLILPTHLKRNDFVFALLYWSWSIRIVSHIIWSHFFSNKNVCLIKLRQWNGQLKSVVPLVWSIWIATATRSFRSVTKSGAETNKAIGERVSHMVLLGSLSVRSGSLGKSSHSS